MHAQKEKFLQKFHDMTTKMKSYEEALGIMHWDLRTGAPRKGAKQRAKTIGSLSEDMFKLSVSDEMEECLDVLEQTEVLDTLSTPDRKMIFDARKEFNRNRKIPSKIHQEYVILTSHAETVWEEAKKKSDYTLFAPYLRDIVTKTQQLIDYWGVKETRYDTLLDMYEPDMTVAKLDTIFEELKEGLLSLVHRVQTKKKTAGACVFVPKLCYRTTKRNQSLFIEGNRL